jgi:hypothetical protein
MKEIKLWERGDRLSKLVALVDDEDYELVQKYSWWPNKTYRAIYARTNINGNSTYMHQLVLPNINPLLETSHKDGNGLNNQKNFNLELITHAQNLANRSKQKNNTSGHKGVSWDKSRKLWLTQLVIKGVKFSKRFSSLEKASDYYKQLGGIC